MFKRFFLLALVLVLSVCNYDGYPVTPEPSPTAAVSPTPESTQTPESSPTACTAVDWYSDGDGDGYGSIAVSSINACESPGESWVTDGGDCDDANTTINPGIAEVCEDGGVDENCNGLVNEPCDRDGDGYCADTVCSDSADQPGDCDDQDGISYPGAEEVCDGKDNNCDGLVDEGFDQDGDGFVNQYACPDGVGDDCDDADPDVNPDAEEVCDGIDNDCDEDVDENCRSFPGSDDCDSGR